MNKKDEKDPQSKAWKELEQINQMSEKDQLALMLEACWEKKKTVG